ncbi:TIGR04255 family protein [Paraburkholderia sp. J63]|uniref:TIGR04255 family protein n=1 Tax=Paraburkholderia sp. J63 TaxID=2805434 RepID=UPI002ABDDF4A|nr:TIGR04255 family protein [Paraburkholderia sp. J63]
MKIAPSNRVKYAHNPLAEVVCQLRFDRLVELDSSEPAEFQAALSNSTYPNRTVEQPVGISLHVATNGPVSVPQLPAPPARVFQFAAADSSWRVSLCSDFVALSTNRYESWDDFQPRMLELVEIFAKCYSGAVPKRLGLRYKDVIERESLGLADTPWHELVKPFLLGPLAPGALSDDSPPDEGEIGNLLLQSRLKLEDCMLLLQSTLLRSIDGGRQAFLIDGDFFTEDATCLEMLRDATVFRGALDKLHNNAGALFQRCITGKLHNALSPEST